MIDEDLLDEVYVVLYTDPDSGITEFYQVHEVDDDQETRQKFNLTKKFSSPAFTIKRMKILRGYL